MAKSISNTESGERAVQFVLAEVRCPCEPRHDGGRLMIDNHDLVRLPHFTLYMAPVR